MFINHTNVLQTGTNINCVGAYLVPSEGGHGTVVKVPAFASDDSGSNPVTDICEKRRKNEKEAEYHFRKGVESNSTMYLL